jgi:hypothetical protein
MDLGSKIQAFSEEARRILLQKALEQKTQKSGKAFWQGYTTNGNGIVKKDGIYIVVKVIGNISIPKNTIVYVDEQNTIEIGFKKSLPVARGQKKEQLKPTIADKIKRPLLLIVQDGIAIGDYVLYYGYEDYVETLNVTSINRYYKNPTGGSSITGTDTVAVTHQSNSNKNTYYFGGFAAYVSTLSFASQSVESHAKLTGTPFDTEVIAAATNGVDTDYVAVTGFGAYSSDFTANIDWQAQASSSNSGRANFSFDTKVFTLPRTEYFIQSAPSQAGQDTYVQLDLQNYFSDPVCYFHELHTYTKKTQTGAVTTYLIFYVRTSDFNTTHVYNNYSGGLTEEFKYVGALKHFYLHLKIDHSTGNVASRATQQTTRWTGDPFDTNPPSSPNLNRVGREWFAAIHSDVYYYLSVDVDVVLTNKFPSGYAMGTRVNTSYQDILSQTFEGDWLYEWRNVQVGDFIDDFDHFLRMHYHDGTWYIDSLNGGPLRSYPNYNLLSYSTDYQSFKYYVPSQGTTGFGGLPGSTSASEITNLLITVDANGTEVSYDNYFDGSVQGVPDDYSTWVQWYTSGLSPVTSIKGPAYNSLVNASDRREPWFSYVQSPP